jgi:hypothetical protein
MPENKLKKSNEELFKEVLFSLTVPDPSLERLKQSLARAAVNEHQLEAIYDALVTLFRSLPLPKQSMDSLPSYRLTLELREWALRQATEEEIVAGLKEVREKGGTELGELIHELKQGLQDCEHRHHP